MKSPLPSLSSPRKFSSTPLFLTVVCRLRFFSAVCLDKMAEENVHAPTRTDEQLVPVKLRSPNEKSNLLMDLQKIDKPILPALQMLWCVVMRTNVDYAELIWEEFIQEIKNFLFDMANLKVKRLRRRRKLQKLPKEQHIKDQYILQRWIPVTQDASTGPSAQPLDDTSANVVHYTSSPTDSTNDAEIAADMEQPNNETDTEILDVVEERGKEVSNTMALEERTVELDERQARSDPGKTLESRPLPEREFMKEDQAGSDHGQSHVVHAMSKPLPLGGPSGQVTIQAQYFFNKDLLEELVPSLWTESESASDISLAYGILHLWFNRKKFYIKRHSSPSDHNAVRSYMKILSVVSLKTFSRYGYTFLKEIVLRRADYKECKISEADLKNPHTNDFKDMYMLNLQGKLNHLFGADKVHLSTVVNLWTRNIVIRQCVEDLQLGIESYQTKLNITQSRRDANDFLFKEFYTIIHKLRDVIYKDRNN
nr:hypothetical protein [Tanacetum cinerariifolium]